MKCKNEKCKISNKEIMLDLNINNERKIQMHGKKEKTLKWGNTLKSLLNNSLLISQPLDVSNYKIIKKNELCNEFNKMQISSESSTGVSTKEIENYNQIIKINIDEENSNLYDSLIISKTLINDKFDDKNNNNNFNPNESIYYTMTEPDINEIRTVDDMGLILKESIMENKENEFIWDNSIRILNFISQGAQAKVFLGLVIETDSYVAIKRYLINYNEEDLNRIIQECELIKMIEHKNIIKYFDFEYINIEEANENLNEFDYDDDNSIMTRIDLIMEFVNGMNLKDYLNKHREEDFGLPLDIVKYITRNLLEGLQHLHDNKIIHRDLKPENVLVTDDLTEIKIADFGISTKVRKCETFLKRSVLGTAYYMAPEVISEKPYAYEADIWSLGCIVYELVSGVKPYGNLNPVNAMYSMIQYASPIEYAEEHIKDIFYEKKNRNLLDFLQKCWRPNNSFRPSSTELLDHAFLKDEKILHN